MKQIASLYRNAYSGLAPATWWLSFVMLVNRSGTMVLPFMMLYLTRSLHFSIEQAGLVVSLFGMGAVCGGFIGGKLTDKLPFYFIQSGALIGGGLIFLLLGQLTSYPAICGCVFLLSTVNESFRPANSAAIAHYSKPENRTRAYSLNRLAINIGWALGASLGGFIAAHNYHLLFWVDGCTNLIAAGLLWLVLSPSKNTATASVVKVPKTAATKSAYKDKAYLVFIVLTVLFAYCFFQWFSTVPLYLKDKLGLSETYIGWLMASNGIIIALVEMVIVYRLERQAQPLRFIAMGVVLTALSFAVFNMGFIAGVAIVSILLNTMGEMLSMPFMNTYWIGRSRPENRGQYAGLYTIAWSVAQVLGPYTGSAIADKAGFTALWWMVTGLAMVASIGFWCLGRYGRKAKPAMI